MCVYVCLHKIYIYIYSKYVFISHMLYLRI